MIIVTERLTNKLILSSSFSDIETETQNALNCGFTEEEIEVKEIINEEYQTILDNQPQQPQQMTDSERITMLEEAINMLMMM